MFYRCPFFQLRRVLSAEWCELLVGRPLEMCGSTISATRPVSVVDDAYPYPYPTRAEDFYPRLHWNG